MITIIAKFSTFCFRIGFGDRFSVETRSRHQAFPAMDADENWRRRAIAGIASNIRSTSVTQDAHVKSTSETL
ncbi:MAG: hypothetical protein ABFS02_08305 [Pseudomonadota bacterium]